MEVRKLIEKMTGVCPVPLFSPAQFTEAACQFRYTSHTHTPTSTVCMLPCMEVDVDFLSMCESVACRVIFYNHNPSLSHTHTQLHIFSHSEPIQPSAHQQIPEGKNYCVSRVSKTKTSVFCVQVTDVQPFLYPLSQPHI